MASEEIDTSTIKSDTTGKKDSVIEKSKEEDIKNANNDLLSEEKKDEARNSSDEKTQENANSVKDPNFDKG